VTSWQRGTINNEKTQHIRAGFRAEDEVRTRDLQLGKLSLYQLSYFRKSFGGLQM
jgi:hypothetical protein